MPPQALYRSEAFAEDLSCDGAAPLPIPRRAAPVSALVPRAIVGPLLWPLAVALTAATVLTVLGPLV